MVEGRLKLEPEAISIFKCIDEGNNFLLSGGAGSGKTYTLVSVIRQVISENPTTKVACMTYTNSAVREIEERVDHKNLNVTTIHDFLWDNIKHYQKELKSAIVCLANDELKTKIKMGKGDPIPDNFFDNLERGIQYKEYLKIQEGIISHEEVLIIANYLFEKYSKLSDIVKDKYKFLFIDEYQDTSVLVVDIFLKHFKISNKNNIVGFFGDSMQSIYPDGVGDLYEYNREVPDSVIEIKKEQNRRNPSRIIELANKLRTDGIVQVPSNDPNAPNMYKGSVKQGTVLFLHSKSDDINNAVTYLENNNDWDFNNPKETKELNLTHNLIADKAGFRNLMDVYDKDPIIKLKNDILKRIKDNLKKGKPEVEILENDTFDDVVDKFQLINKQKKLKKDILLGNNENNKLYNQLKDKQFSEVRKIYFTKDALIDDKKQDEDDLSKKGSKRDNLIKHLYKIQKNISLYQNRKFNEFLRSTDYRYKILSISDKRLLKENISNLINVGDKSIEDVINDANEKGICLVDDKLLQFIETKEYLYNRVKTIKFKEFQKLYEYLEGHTPFSTQHKTKGAEFDNVLVVLDNGGWNNYNFEKLFLNDTSSSVFNRTQKIFYVCCTRSKNSLAVYFNKPSDSVISKAKEWFGTDNVKSI